MISEHDPCLIVSCPDGYEKERRYIIKVLIEEFLGLKYAVTINNQKEYRVTVYGDPTNKALVLPDIMFQVPSSTWLTQSSLQAQPLDVWDVSADLSGCIVSSAVPIIFGEPSKGIRPSIEKNNIRLGLDIFGAAFFMLTRYEELVKADRDEHDRFPATASLALREGFLERPIIDEYIEILFCCLKMLWPGMKRKEYSYNVCVSHDIDHLFSLNNDNWPISIKKAAGDIIKRKKPELAIQRLISGYTKRKIIDPLNAISFIMEKNEQFDLVGEFYFLTEHTCSFDGGYQIDNPEIKVLLKQIHEHGHKIGIHPSYNSYRSSPQIGRELNKLLDVVDQLNIKQEKWGGRQHYLRWENPTTWQIWNDAGLDYDSTLSFPEQVGFRCGTSRSYSVFNVKTRMPLKLKETPLLVMDRTLLDKKYMGLNRDRALSKIVDLSNKCKHYNGTFSILLHHTTFIEDASKKLYIEILEAITS